MTMTCPHCGCGDMEIHRPHCTEMWSSYGKPGLNGYRVLDSGRHQWAAKPLRPGTAAVSATVPRGDGPPSAETIQQLFRYNFPVAPKIDPFKPLPWEKVVGPAGQDSYYCEVPI